MRITPNSDVRIRNNNPMTEYFELGESVHAKWVDGEFYSATITARNDDHTFDVMFYDGVNQENLGINDLRYETEDSEFSDDL